MRIVVAGSHGLIGGALLPALRDGGHEVVRLVRRATDGPDEISWDPDLGQLDATSLDEVDAVVNLAGVNVGERPLTRERKRQVLTSRVRTTALLSRTLASADPSRARVLLQGSAIGAYGDRGDDVLTESEPYGDTFFADVVRRWEAATAPAQRAGVRVVHLRTGVVLAPQGGALVRLLPLIKAGLGGPLGSGRQFWSWITLPDQVRAIEHLLRSPVHGPVNLVAEPTRNAEVVAALAEAFGRPARLAVPSVALRLALGDFAPEILGSVRAVPAVLSGAGFRFSHPDITAAAAWVRASSAH
ncbi:MAG: TIGR01777 family oxidoreductase [Actinobacteria bacterium]|nr:TIGR01777 family oxidoreductase [Actinomycetota bacterium]MCG2802239.1 TIGR01777 family oxidoreductase [Cellulomonas sp.]